MNPWTRDDTYAIVGAVLALVLVVAVCVLAAVTAPAWMVS